GQPAFLEARLGARPLAAWVAWRTLAVSRSAVGRGCRIYASLCKRGRSHRRQVDQPAHHRATWTSPRRASVSYLASLLPRHRETPALNVTRRRPAAVPTS